MTGVTAFRPPLIALVTLPIGSLGPRLCLEAGLEASDTAQRVRTSSVHSTTIIDLLFFFTGVVARSLWTDQSWSISLLYSSTRRTYASTLTITIFWLPPLACWMTSGKGGRRRCPTTRCQAAAGFLPSRRRIFASANGEMP